MKRLICLSVTAVTLTLTLAGCGKESDELPVDGREFDGVEYSQPAPYTGKVIDGYLNNARVWLDMDGDSQYSPGPLVIELDNGEQVTLTSGEPTTMSGPGGVFELDTSALVLPPGVGPDLDPRDYPLFAVAIPGTTLQETSSGDVPVTDAYLMSAAPGVRNITPLTTLDRYRRMVGLISLANIPALSALADLNLVRDYLLAGDERAHAYARALARFMASQLPRGYNALLTQPGSDGTEYFLSREAAFLLGVSLVQNAGRVAEIVDQAAGGDYASVNVDALSLPEVALELTDPVLLTRQTVYAEPAVTGALPANPSGLEVSAELVFDYGADGRIRSVSARGCLAPSLPELARVVRVNGRLGELATQWLPSVSLSAQSRISYEASGIDERLVFDWDARRIYFDTTTTCHQSEGVAPDSSELDGTPEIVYSWVLDSNGLASLSAVYTAGPEYVLTPQADNATGVFPGYRIEQGGSEQEAVSLASGVQTCAVADQDAGADQIANGYQPYVFSGHEPQPAGFTDLALQFDARAYLASGEPSDLRLLSYGFLDPSLTADSRVSGEGGFRWLMRYALSGEAGFFASHPSLIQEAYLAPYNTPADCGREFRADASSAYARLTYDYQRLSDYLVGSLQ